LADRVKDPEKFEAASFERFGGAKDGLEICFGALVAEKHYADGEGDFGVDNVLGEELSGEVLDDQGVVLGSSEKGSDPFEGVEEAEKIRVRVAAANFVFADGNAMTSCELRHDSRTDTAFEVEMQFGFRERQDVFRKGTVGHSRAGERLTQRAQREEPGVWGTRVRESKTEI